MASLSSPASAFTRLSKSIVQYREVILALGAIAGLVAALASIVAPTEQALKFGAVAAYVNDGQILRADYDRAIALLQTDRRSPLTEADKRQVLSRLIEEELLVQRARDMGLTESDPAVRKLLIRTMLDTVAAQSRPSPGESALRAYFDANQDLFKSPPLVEAARIVVRKSAADAQERLTSIRTSLSQHESFAETKRKFSDTEIIPLPQEAIPAAKLRDYVGPAVVERVLALGEGEIAEIDTGPSIEFVQLLSRSETTARYEDVAEDVAARYAREQDEAAFKDYLAQLKSSADIAIDEELR